MWEKILQFLNETGSVQTLSAVNESGKWVGWMNIVMIALSCVLLFFAIKKGFEPYLLIPIAVGMLLVNIFTNIYYDPN